MNTRLLIGTLGIFTSLILLAYGCSADRSYRDEYIQLLEEKLSNQSTAPEAIEEKLIDEDDVRAQVIDVLNFACGSSSSIQDIRVRQSSKEDWSVIVVLETDSIDKFGFNVQKKIYLEGSAEAGGIIEFENLDKLLSECE